jgi:hypothetical protein
MGMDTGLYLGNRWDFNDLIDVLDKRLGVKAKVENTHTPDYTVITFEYKGEQRQMNVHRSTNTPLGRFTMITLGKWGACEGILKGIAAVLGGLYYDNDCDYKLEFIEGELDDLYPL